MQLALLKIILFIGLFLGYLELPIGLFLIYHTYTHLHFGDISNRHLVLIKRVLYGC